MRRTLLLVLAIFLLGLSGNASAQNKAASDLDDQARAYYRAGAYVQAAEAFQKAYKLEPNSSRLFNAGRAYEQAGDKRKASEQFARFLAVESEGDKVVEARARKAKLDTEIAEEEQEAARKAAEEAKNAAARKHTEAASKHIAEQRYEEAANAFEEAFKANGDSEYLFDKAESLRLAGDKSGAIAEYMRYQRMAPEGRNVSEARSRQRELEHSNATPGQEETSSSPIAGTMTGTHDTRDRGSSTLRVSGYVVMGLGLALGATSIAFVFRARSKESELEGLDPSAMEAWNEDTYQDGVDAESTAIQLGLASGAALIGGAILYLKGRPDESSKSSVSISPSLGSGSAGISFGGSF